MQVPCLGTDCIVAGFYGGQTGRGSSQVRPLAGTLTARPENWNGLGDVEERLKIRMAAPWTASVGGTSPLEAKGALDSPPPGEGHLRRGPDSALGLGQCDAV